MKLVDALNLTLWAILTAAVVWRGSVLLRIRGRTPLRVGVFVVFVTQWVSLTGRLPSGAERLNQWAPGLAHVAVNVALIGSSAGFITILGSYLRRVRWFARCPLQVGIAVACGTVMVLSWALSPGTLPGYDGLTAAAPMSGYWFYLIGDLYLGYAATVAAVLAFDAAKEPDVTQPGAFRACGVGLAAVVIGAPVVRIPSLVVSLAVGSDIPVKVDTVGKMVVIGGLGLAVLAMCAIGVRTLAFKHQYRTELRSTYPDMHCLAAFLYEYLGPIGLYRRAGRWRLTFALVTTYVERVGYCRDGLWLISKYVDQEEAALYTDQNGVIPIEAQALLVWEAAERMINGERALGPPFTIAAPDDDEAEDDNRQLVLLSEALERIIAVERVAEMSA